MAETQVIKVRLVTLEQRVLLVRLVAQATQAILETQATTVLLVMVVLLVMAMLVQLGTLVGKVLVAAVAAVAAAVLATSATRFIALKTALLSSETQAPRPTMEIQVTLVGQYPVEVMAVPPEIKTPTLVFLPFLTLVVAVPRVTLEQVVTRVLRGTPTPGARVIRELPEQMAMQETPERVPLPGARVIRELPETKELLATLVMLALAGMLVSIQPSVIL